MSSIMVVPVDWTNFSSAAGLALYVKPRRRQTFCVLVYNWVGFYIYYFPFGDKYVTNTSVDKDL